MEADMDVDDDNRVRQPPASMNQLRYQALDRVLKRRYSEVDNLSTEDAQRADAAMAMIRGARLHQRPVFTPVAGSVPTVSPTDADPIPRDKKVNSNGKRRRSDKDDDDDDNRKQNVDSADPDHDKGRSRSKRHRVDEAKASTIDKLQTLPRLPPVGNRSRRFAREQDCFDYVQQHLRRVKNVGANNKSGSSSSSSSSSSWWRHAAQAKPYDGDSDDDDAFDPEKEANDLLTRLTNLSLDARQSVTSGGFSLAPSNLQALIAIGRTFLPAEFFSIGADESALSLMDHMAMFLRSSAAEGFIKLAGQDELLGVPNGMLFAMAEEALGDDADRRAALYTAFRQSLAPVELFFLDMNALSDSDRQFVACSLVADDGNVHAVFAAVLLQTCAVAAETARVTMAGLPWLAAWKLARQLSPAMPTETQDANAIAAGTAVQTLSTTLAQVDSYAYAWLTQPNARNMLPFITAEQANSLALDARAIADESLSASSASAALRNVAVQLREAVGSYGRLRLGLTFLTGASMRASRGESAGINERFALLQFSDPELVPVYPLPRSLNAESPLITMMRLLADRLHEMSETDVALNIMLLLVDSSNVCRYLLQPTAFAERRFARDPVFFISRILGAESIVAAAPSGLARRIALRALLSRPLLLEPAQQTDVDDFLFPCRSLNDVVVALLGVKGSARLTFTLGDACRAHLVKLVKQQIADDRHHMWPIVYCCLLALMQVSKTFTNFNRLFADVFSAISYEDPQFSSLAWIPAGANGPFATLHHLLEQRPGGLPARDAGAFRFEVLPLVRKVDEEYVISPLALFARIQGRLSLSFMTALKHALRASADERRRILTAYQFYTYDIPLAPLDLARMQSRLGEDGTALLRQYTGYALNEVAPRYANIISTMLGSDVLENVNTADGVLVGMVVRRLVQQTKTFPKVTSRGQALMEILAGCMSSSLDSLYLFGRVFEALHIDALGAEDRRVFMQASLYIFHKILASMMERGIDGARIVGAITALYGKQQQPPFFFTNPAAAAPLLQSLVPSITDVVIDDNNLINVILALEALGGGNPPPFAAKAGSGPSPTLCSRLFNLYRSDM